jgi:hypothetical protein
MRPRPARFTRKARRPEQELPTRNPWKLLALAIIEEAQRDLTSGNPYWAADARAFLESAGFEQLADFVGIHPDWGRRKLFEEAALAARQAMKVAVK